MEFLNNDTNKFSKPVLEIKKASKKNPTLDGFMEILNPERVRKGFKPLTYSRLGFLLQHLDEWDKSIFLGSCKDAKNPSAYFWWALKNK